ncbi:MAG: AAA family ATPase [Caldilineaceae bacterium SB0661_bin_32]|uniref:AAA family ATPase n=1 Tax=Caldilineaceae bacterium SB0661_bin_32 TaxID=2605255 RepID=A0A6B1D7U4_9CHLR|nr:AAA family ATPase [Caldilineaceae bacterium SB0661_bin_32]
MTLHIADDLDLLLAVLPEHICASLQKLGRASDLIEIVMDLGRLPEARFPDGEVRLSPEEITRDDLQQVIDNIGDFGADNRAGIERTLHRISAIRNRKGTVIGLTCRVGRAVYGVIDIIQDIITSGSSLLLLGRPGVGKTTLLREASRVLSDKQRVVIVDTSNEIAGDGDIPHPSIGRARRMQVATPTLQHEVMIEAVENHMPEAIIIDEIGRELEAVAARTIAERGVQLIGTAHGNTLENLLMNPTLSDLVGGIDTVTLSDEEARRRGTQKTVLERKAPPTFDVLIEIQERQRMIVHHKVAEAVDSLLRGWTLSPETRYVNSDNQVHIESVENQERPGRIGQSRQGPESSGGGRRRQRGKRAEERAAHMAQDIADGAAQPNGDGQRKAVRVFAYGIGQNRLRTAAQNLKVPVQVVKELHDADIVMTLKNYFRQKPPPIADAERQNVPVYVLRSNTVTQMEQYLLDVFQLRRDDPDLVFDSAMRETQHAIQRLLKGEKSVELSPQAASIRSQQHQLARTANLISHSYGREPHRCVRIFSPS